MIYLFDLDGTLFDTKLANAMAYKIAINKLGYEFELEDYYKTGGMKVDQWAPAGIDIKELKRLKAIYYKQNLSLIKPIKNVLDLYLSIPQNKKMIVTSAQRENAYAVLNYFGVDFENIITGEDVKTHKPSGECYAKAKSKFGADKKFIAFEDSKEGIAAAREANIRAIKVNDSEIGIADLSGGSQAKTYLMFENSGCSIRKIIPLEFKNRLYSQAQWYKRHGMLISESTCSEFYTIDIVYVDGIRFDEVINKHAHLENIVCKIMEQHKSKLTYPLTETQADEFIQKHIYNCIEKWKPSKVREIEGLIKIMNFKNLLSSCSVTLEDFSDVHGDCTFTNIILHGLPTKNKVTLIDPAPDGNIINNVLFDIAKLGQSVYGYEKIQQQKPIDGYDKMLISEYWNIVSKIFSDNEIKIIKFIICSLYFRRLKHQVVQKPELCETIYNKGKEILMELIDDCKQNRV